MLTIEVDIITRHSRSSGSALSPYRRTGKGVGPSVVTGKFTCTVYLANSAGVKFMVYEDKMTGSPFLNGWIQQFSGLRHEEVGDLTVYYRLLRLLCLFVASAGYWLLV